METAVERPIGGIGVPPRRRSTRCLDTVHARRPEPEPEPEPEPAPHQQPQPQQQPQQQPQHHGAPAGAAAGAAQRRARAILVAIAVVVALATAPARTARKAAAAREARVLAGAHWHDGRRQPERKLPRRCGGGQQRAPFPARCGGWQQELQRRAPRRGQGQGRHWSCAQRGARACVRVRARVCASRRGCRRCPR